MPLLRCPVQVGGCALATNAQPPPPLEWRLNDGSRRHRNVIVLPIGWVARWSGGSDLELPLPYLQLSETCRRRNPSSRCPDR